MSLNCTDIPFGAVLNPAHYIPNAVVIPMLLGIGVLGNLTTIITLNRSYIRVQNSIYVYLTALAVLDLLVLLLEGPGCVRYMGVLTPEEAHSELLAYYSTLRYPFSNILKHSSVWVVAYIAVVRFATTPQTLKRYRWTKLSTSRLIVFLIVMFCVLVDFSRFFELDVTLISDHCFEDMVLWGWEHNDFGVKELYHEVYPWVVLAICVVLPFFIIFLFSLLLMWRVRLWRLCSGKADISQRSHDETRTTLVILALIMVYFILELPDSVMYVLYDMRAHEPPNKHFERSLVATHCFSLVHSSINFILYSVLSKEFRKSFRRTFCCGCIVGDDYIEPMRCPCKQQEEKEPPKADPEPDFIENGPVWI